MGQLLEAAVPERVCEHIFLPELPGRGLYGGARMWGKDPPAGSTSTEAGGFGELRAVQRCCELEFSGRQILESPACHPKKRGRASAGTGKPEMALVCSVPVELKSKVKRNAEHCGSGGPQVRLSGPDLPTVYHVGRSSPCGTDGGERALAGAGCAQWVCLGVR